MEIPDFYRGRSVLLTGGTGFIGKALVEKLLRCCPEVERLYLLVRDKDGVSAEKRLSQLLALPVFAGCPIAKVTAVAGDVSVPGLGLSDEDRDVLVSHVSVVLHSAATIIFTEPLPLAVLLNVESVRHVVQLARAMKQLAAFVHVSTAYSNCNLPSVREEVYPPPADVHDMIRRAKEDPDGLERDATQLIGDRPNTYTFTKALAESLLVEEAADLPLAIVRPSIVGWAWRDPSPGYTDSANGMMGPLVLLAQGVVRSSLINVNCVVDLVPVDLVVNTVLAVAWHTARRRPPEARQDQDLVGAAPRTPARPTVYNCVTGAHNPLLWSELVPCWLYRAREQPPATAVWWPFLYVTTSPRMYRLCSFLTMILPAAFHDAVIAPLLERPATMLRKTRKVIRLLEAISPFSITDWDFKDDNVRGLWSLLSGRDRVLFPLDVEAIDWDTYCKAALAGSKRYLLKEDGAVGHPRRLYLLHRLTQTALASVLLALLGWATWPYLARLWPSSTVKFIKFVLSKC